MGHNDPRYFLKPFEKTENCSTCAYKESFVDHHFSILHYFVFIAILKLLPDCACELESVCADLNEDRPRHPMKGCSLLCECAASYQLSEK